jgi:hypothetical protein
MKPEQLRRLAQLLGMTGSEFAGEALNAARLADQLVRDSGLTWEQVLHTTPPAPSRAERQRPWRPVAQECLRSRRLLRSREQEFLTGILERDYRQLTPKQAAWLSDIAQDLGVSW